MMKLADLSDESLLAYYESVRRQVAADNHLGGRYRIVGRSIRRYAEELGAEMMRRQLRFTPIDWR